MDKPSSMRSARPLSDLQPDKQPNYVRSSPVLSGFKARKQDITGPLRPHEPAFGTKRSQVQILSPRPQKLVGLQWPKIHKKKLIGHCKPVTSTTKVGRFAMAYQLFLMYLSQFSDFLR